MKKRFNLGNILVLAILSVILLSGCGAMEKIAGNNEGGGTPQDSIYYVQAGAFHNQDYSQERAKKLSKKFSYRLEITEDDNLYRIRLGPFDIKPEALECKNVLIKEGYDDAFINARLDTLENPE